MQYIAIIKFDSILTNAPVCFNTLKEAKIYQDKALSSNGVIECKIYKECE